MGNRKGVSSWLVSETFSIVNGSGKVQYFHLYCSLYTWMAFSRSSDRKELGAMLEGYGWEHLDMLMTSFC